MISLKNEFLYVSIIENCGFTVSEINFNNHNILYFPFSEDEYKKNLDLAGIPFLYPYANRLSRKKFILENKSILIKKNTTFYDGNGLPLHGFLLKTDKWKIKEKNNTFIIAEIDFCSDLYTLFPYKHKIEYKIELKKNEVHFYIKIFPYEKLPISFGFHPYFSIYNRNNTKLYLPAQKLIKTNKYLIPTGKLLDLEYFLLKNKINSKKEKNHFVLPLNFDWDHGFTDLKKQNDYNNIQLLTDYYKLNLVIDPFYQVLQVYSPNEKNFVCIEPMIATTNAFIDKKYITISENTTFHFYLLIEKLM